MRLCDSGSEAWSFQNVFTELQLTYTALDTRRWKTLTDGAMAPAFRPPLVPHARRIRPCKFTAGRGRAQQSALSAGRCCPRAGAEHAALATGKKWGTGPGTRRRSPEPGRNGTSLIPKLHDVKQATRPRLEETVTTLRAVAKRKCSHARLEHDLQAPSSR